MTRKEIKDLLPIMQAYAEGKPIQYLADDKKWIDIDDPTFVKQVDYYRIKPEPQYRPFKTKEECWNEMHKHPDFGWVRNKREDKYINISELCKYYSEEKILINNCSYILTKAFYTFIFTDGTPFGIKEE